MLQEGSGEPVGVEGAAGSQVACDKPLGGLDCELCSLVGLCVVGRGDPVCDSLAAYECVHGLGAENTGTVGGDLLGSSPPGKVLTKYLNDVGRVVFGQPEH